jgi:hypothetical protein
MLDKIKKPLWMALVAAVTSGALSMTAVASGPGALNHFTSTSHETILDINEATGSGHETTLSLPASTITCHNATYVGALGTTATSITVDAHYTNCTHGGSSAHVRMNGCAFVSTAPGAGAHATVHLECPLEKKLEVDATGSSLFKFGSQTPKGGIVFTTTVTSGVHTLTANITTEGLVAECHGACQILGTTQAFGKLTGSLTIEGTNDFGARRAITAT